MDINIKRLIQGEVNRVLKEERKNFLNEIIEAASDVLLEFDGSTNEQIVLDYMRSTIEGTKYQNRIFLAGGAVRDEVMGRLPKDLDFVVNYEDINAGIDFANWLAHKLGVYKEDSNPVVFERFGTAKLSLNGNNKGLPNVELEFVAPRSESYTEGSRKPEVSASDLKGDVMRRDLTINSLLKDISSGEILDLTGHGLEDIKDGVVRTSLDPDVIFKDDPLRMLRAIRFTSKYGFEMTDDVLNGIKRNAHLIDNISSERISDELNKILVSDRPSEGIELMRDTGLLKYVIPELQDAVGMGQNKYHNKDVFGHTMDVLRNTPNDLNTRLMALFHDIGKTLTRTVDDGGNVHFYGHEQAGVDVVKSIMSRLKYPNNIINAVASGVLNHMRLKNGGDDATGISDKALRKFKDKVGDNLIQILDLIHADNISHADASSMPNQIRIVRDRLDKLNDKIDANKVNKLPINGKDIIEHFNITPSPIIGQILSAVKEEWYGNPNMSKEEAFEIAGNIINGENNN